MQPSISNLIEISNPRSVVTKHVANKCGKFYLRCDTLLLEHKTVTSPPSLVALFYQSLSRRCTDRLHH